MNSDNKDKHIQDLKFRINELKDLIEKHADALTNVQQYTNNNKDSHKIIEQLRIDRLNTLERTRMEPEDY